MSVVLIEKFNITDNSEELIGATEYLTLQARCCITVITVFGRIYIPAVCVYKPSPGREAIARVY